MKFRITATTKEHCIKRLKECGGDSSATWKLVKEIELNQKRDCNTQKFQSNKNILDIAETLNIFSRKYSQDDLCSYTTDLDNNSNPISLQDVSTSECKKVIE